jgi:hypothetical protein|tara:strand:- start:115 stop:291 length:177 start_codon:yes stop_codon:yes gene_type:complete
MANIAMVLGAVVFACGLIKNGSTLLCVKRAFQNGMQLQCAVENFKKKRFWFRLNTWSY